MIDRSNFLEYRYIFKGSPEKFDSCFLLENGAISFDPLGEVVR